MPVVKWIDGKLVEGTLTVAPSHKFRPRLVLKVTQSPMNPRQWLFYLGCGYEQWATAKSRPTRKTMNCHTCAAADGDVK